MFIELDCESVWQLLDIADRSRQELDFDTAIACYQKVLSLQPKNSDIYLQLGNVFNQQQQSEGAIFAYQKALDLKPEQPVWVYRNLGTLLTKQQQYDRAIAIYRALINLYPSRASEIYIKIGDIYQQQNKFFQAKAAYQNASWSRALFNINEVIACIRRYFVTDLSLLNIDILDNGCDPTGRQLALLAEQTRGRVVGTNINRGFPQAWVKRCRANNEFYWMDGQNLTFDSNSFDLVISLNVLEHVPNPARYLHECYRVLRPGGIGFFSWYPLWSGATGHHVHPDMVSRMSQKLGLTPPSYSLDGSSIPFWGHLLFDSSQMLSFLIEEKKYHPTLAEWMNNYIYYDNDLNRWFWRDVWHSFEHTPWEVIEIKHRGQQLIPPEISNQLQRRYGVVDNFSICGAKIIVRK